MIHFVATFPIHTSTGAERIFSLAVDEAGALVATAFGELDALKRRANLGEVFRDRQRTGAAAAEIEAYFAGEITTFRVPLAAKGTPFQLRVWSALRDIPYGKTCSYGDLAKKLKSSPRAVGRGNATNPICLVVPCHRVIGVDGSLTGFAFGEEVKRELLNHEAAVLRRAAS